MLEKYYRLDKATGVSIYLQPDGSQRISTCSLVVDDNKLDFEKKVASLTSIEELANNFPTGSLIALNLFGKGILQKQIEKNAEINAANFSQILPNANFQDFYIQHFVSGDSAFVSVVRKSVADHWTELLIKQGYVPLMLSLGPFPIDHILPQLNTYQEELTFDGHLIKFDEKANWLNYKYKPEAVAPFPLKAENEPIDEKLLLAYASAFQLLLANKLPAIKAAIPALEIAYQEQIADKKLKANAFIILGVFFILLLINFLAFSWLNTANTKLADQVSRSAQSSSDLQGINDQVKEKEMLLKTLGWDSGINKSSLVDQLASLLPEELSFRELTVNPIDPSLSRNQRELKFLDRKIRIVGLSEKIIPVNEWIARIKTKKWVKNVELESYNYNTELNTGQFILLLDY